MNAGKKKDRFSLPWSNQGWFPEHVRRGRDPEIQKIIASAGSRRVSPLGFSDDRATIAITPATHNPYINIAVSLIFIALGTFVFVQMASAIVGALVVGGFFWLGGLFIMVINAIRIPSWHHARIAVRAYLREHKGTFPRELRWYN